MDEFHGSFWTFMAVGAFAQMIDGSLGMGYKTSTTTFLLALGVPPVLASSSVHLAGVAASAVSGYSHWRFGNLDARLLRQLALPGVVGGLVGAALLTHVESELIKPVVAVYLFVLGVRIVRKALRRNGDLYLKTHMTVLGLAGGFFDAIGGGGWGPIVTSTLVVNGHDPRTVIGSVNIAEFFVTLMQSFMFILLLDEIGWDIVLGLMSGAVIAAPFAAYVTRFLPTKRLMLLLGVLIVLLSLRTLWVSVF